MAKGCRFFTFIEENQKKWNEIMEFFNNLEIFCIFWKQYVIIVSIMKESYG